MIKIDLFWLVYDFSDDEIANFSKYKYILTHTVYMFYTYCFYLSIEYQDVLAWNHIFAFYCLVSLVVLKIA